MSVDFATHKFMDGIQQYPAHTVNYSSVIAEWSLQNEDIYGLL